MSRLVARFTDLLLTLFHKASFVRFHRRLKPLVFLQTGQGSNTRRNRNLHTKSVWNHTLTRSTDGGSCCSSTAADVQPDAAACSFSTAAEVRPDVAACSSSIACSEVQPDVAACSSSTAAKLRLRKQPTSEKASSYQSAMKLHDPDCSPWQRYNVSYGALSACHLTPLPAAFYAVGCVRFCQTGLEPRTLAGSQRAPHTQRHVPQICNSNTPECSAAKCSHLFERALYT